MRRQYNYYVYIISNARRTVFYIGVTNNIERRVHEHQAAAAQKTKSFTGRYNCNELVYVEHYQYINNAIAREKQLKGWLRQKKLDLIQSVNPEMITLTFE